MSRTFAVVIKVDDRMTTESFVKSYEHSFEVLKIEEQAEWIHLGGTDEAHLVGRCDCKVVK